MIMMIMMIMMMHSYLSIQQHTAQATYQSSQARVSAESTFIVPPISSSTEI